MTRCPTIHELPPPPPATKGWPWTEASVQLAELLPGGKPWPRISIVTPSYNQGYFIEETIRSVLLQGYPDIEFIIVDGASTDDSVEIIKKYEPWLEFWVSEEDRGQSHAINKGVDQATGEILFWLNADDVCLPGTFDIVGRTFVENPQARLVIGQARVIDASSKAIGELGSRFTSWQDLVTCPTNMVRQISAFFARELFTAYGGVDEDLFIAMDTELLLRFTRHCAPLIIDEHLAAYRRHTGAKTSSDVVRVYHEADRVRKVYISTFLDEKAMKRYRIRCSICWLMAAGTRNTPISDRLTCLKRSLTELLLM